MWMLNSVAKANKRANVSRLAGKLFRQTCQRRPHDRNIDAVLLQMLLQLPPKCIIPHRSVPDTRTPPSALSPRSSIHLCSCHTSALAFCLPVDRLLVLGAVDCHGCIGALAAGLVGEGGGIEGFVEGGHA